MLCVPLFRQIEDSLFRLYTLVKRNSIHPSSSSILPLAEITTCKCERFILAILSVRSFLLQLVAAVRFPQLLNTYSKDVVCIVSVIFEFSYYWLVGWMTGIPIASMFVILPQLKHKHDTVGCSCQNEHVHSSFLSLVVLMSFAKI